MWIMPFGAGAATHAGGSRALAWGQRIQDDRRGQRGKNGSMATRTFKLRCMMAGVMVEPAPVAAFKVPQP